MKLRAVMNPINHRWAVKLIHVTRFCIIEVRIQNTITGELVQQYVEADNDGVAVVDLPNFGLHYAITLRLLNSLSSEVLHRMHFDSKGSMHRLSMSSTPEPILQAQTALEG